MPHNREIGLLIATDCISEGQNLQDCDYLVNDHLLQQAVTSIASTCKRRAVGAFLDGRSGVLPDRAQQVSAATDFELITWLVSLP